MNSSLNPDDDNQLESNAERTEDKETLEDAGDAEEINNRVGRIDLDNAVIVYEEDHHNQTSHMPAMPGKFTVVQNEANAEKGIAHPLPPIKEKRIIVEIHFNSYGWNKKVYTKKWIDYRMNVFMRFTCRSLKKQTDSNFKAFIYYAARSESLIKRALSRYAKLPPHIQFVRLTDRKRRTLAAIKGHKLVYFVRIDSDDMYRKNFIAQLHAYKPKPGTAALINQRGFWYDSVRKRMAAVIRTSPPFYTLIYKTQDFNKGRRYRLHGHGSVIRFRHELLKPRNYVVVIHGKNTSTKFRIRKKTDYIVKRLQMKSIMTRFM